MNNNAKSKNLELQLAYLSLAMERLGEMVIVTDLDHIITYANPAVEEILGYTPQELIGSSAGVIFDNIPGNPPNLAPWITEQKVKEVWRGEVLNRRKDGSIIKIHLTLNWLRDHAGIIIGCVGVSVDISERKKMEGALQESEERFRNLTEYIPGVSIQGYRPDGTIFYWNRASEKIYGYPAREAIGRNLADLIIPSNLRALFEKALKEGKRVKKSGEFLPPGELELRDKMGRPVPVYSIHTAVYIKGKDPELFCIDVDLSKRKKMESALRQARDELEQRVVERTAELAKVNIELREEMKERSRAENALRESEERFRTIFDNAKDAIFIEALDGRILDVNKAVSSMLGYTKEELLTRRVGDIVPPEVAAELPPTIQESSVRNGIYIETEDLRKDGTRVPVEVSNTIVTIGGEERVIAIVRDITKRKLAEGEVRKFKTIADEANYGTAITDLGGNLIYLNRHFARMHQHEPAELLGRNLSVLHTEKQMERVDSLNNRLKVDGVYHAEEVWHKKKDGTVFPTMMNATIIKDVRGIPLYISATAVDISDRYRAGLEKREMEEQLRQAQKMEVVARLAGGMAHDFGNLLNAVRGYVEVLRNQLHEEDPLQKEIQELEDTVVRAGQLNRRLLTLGRRQPVRPEELNLNTVLADLENMLRRVCGSGIEVDFVLEPELRAIRADQSQLEQIIINLIFNAREAINRRGTITVRTDTIDLSRSSVPRMIGKQPGSYVLLAFNDTGCGMDNQNRARLFEPFFTTKDAGNNTGLGLSIVYGIVEQSGGFIQVESELGRGSTFNIYFPAQEKSDAGRSRKIRILLMDDEEAVRSTTGKLLAGIGCEVKTAPDDRLAIELFQRGKEAGRPFDIVLLDLMIPGGSGGVEALRRLREIDPDVKAVLYSGYTTAPAMTNYRKVGFAATLTKPFTLERLRAVLSEVLGE